MRLQLESPAYSPAMGSCGGENYCYEVRPVLPFGVVFNIGRVPAHEMRTVTIRLVGRQDILVYELLESLHASDLQSARRETDLPTRGHENARTGSMLSPGNRAFLDNQSHM
jgi:hypothetical protein